MAVNFTAIKFQAVLFEVEVLNFWAVLVSYNGESMLAKSKNSVESCCGLKKNDYFCDVNNYLFY